MPVDPFDDLESLFENNNDLPRPKGGYTPTRKEAVVRAPVMDRTPTRKEAIVGPPVAKGPSASDDAAPFRPTRRPPMAMLCVLDDGSEEGDWVRIRNDHFVIGRTQGDVQIPHDPMIAPKHAEISRQVEKGKYIWHLTDLQSPTGTFVQVPQRPLRHGSELWMGSRRYLFEMTPMVCLSEIGGSHRSVILDPPAVTFGRSVVNDDPCLSKVHARFDCGPDGRWSVVTLGGKNGIWVRTERVRFVANIRFQLGEQRFFVEICT